MNKEGIEYIYDCYMYNILNNRYNIIWRDLKDVEPHGHNINWENHSHTNECIEEYKSNKALMGKDIIDNGMYMGLTCRYSDGNGVLYLRNGIHRYEGLKHYYKENNYINKKMFMFICVENYYIENDDDYKYMYIVPKYKKHKQSFKSEKMDLYVNDEINKKHFIKDLEYDMCLIQYSDHPIFAIDAIAEFVSPLIWQWNKRNDDKIKAKKIVNDMAYFYDKKDDFIKELNGRLLK